MAPFGLARGLSTLLAAGTHEREDGRALVERLTSVPDRWRSALNAAASIAVAAAAAATWPATGGWAEAAAAALAVVFAWAAASKLTAWRRWRAAVAAHRLPAPLERAALPLVPAVEVLVPILAIAGRGRAASAVALAALLAFTAATVRFAIREGTTVPCGCFGHARVDVRTALARDVLLAALAVVSWARSAADPPLRAPVDDDLLPAILAAGALVAAAITLWRATVWIQRGRG
jgi:hypothetical protein